MIEFETDALLDVLKLSDVDIDKLADSLGVIETEAAATDCDSLPESEGLAVVDSPVVVESLVAVDSLEAVEAAADSDPLADVDSDSLLDWAAVVEMLVDSGAADSLVLCDIDSVVDSAADSVAETLVTPVLPGVRTALPAVARVFRLVAVTSYETGGGMADTIYGPSSPNTVSGRVGLRTVGSPLLGADLACGGGFRWANHVGTGSLIDGVSAGSGG